jgi:hypothetical protein
MRSTHFTSNACEDWAEQAASLKRRRPPAKIAEAFFSSPGVHPPLKRSTLFCLACEALGLQALLVGTEGILGFPPLCRRPLCFATALFHPFLPLHARGGWLHSITVNHPISTHWGNNCSSMRLSRAFPWIARAHFRHRWPSCARPSFS